MLFNVTDANSRRLSCVKSRGTLPELMLRKRLWQAGLRGYRKHPQLPGKPDLIYPRKMIAIFIDGCFWHGCPNHFRLPKNNSEWWANKVQRNKQRDIDVQNELEALSYQVLRFWEHDVKQHPDQIVEKIRKMIT